MSKGWNPCVLEETSKQNTASVNKYSLIGTSKHGLINVSMMKAGFRKEQLLEYWLLWSDRGCYGDYADCWYPSNQQLVPESTVEGPYWVGPTGGRPQGTALPESTYWIGSSA
jgi:hypothetical protein